MKKALLASAACAALGLASVSQAAVVVTAINQGTPVGSGGTLATGYTGWVLRVTSDSGNISGLDLDAGGGGIFGQMIQRWTASGGDGTFDTPTPVSTFSNVTGTTNVNNFDSHILPPGGNASNILSAVPPNEDNVISGNQPGLPANNDNAAFGRGTFIKAAFGVAGPAQSSVYDFAYLVLPNGSEASVNGHANIATAGGTFTNVPIAIPEPMSMSLAGIGALGLLVRRRRA
jgi:hypothetical protein